MTMTIAWQPGDTMARVTDSGGGRHTIAVSILQKGSEPLVEIMIRGKKERRRKGEEQDLCDTEDEFDVSNVPLQGNSPAYMESPPPDEESLLLHSTHYSLPFQEGAIQYRSAAFGG